MFRSIDSGGAEQVTVSFEVRDGEMCVRSSMTCAMWVTDVVLCVTVQVLPSGVDPSKAKHLISNSMCVWECLKVLTCVVHPEVNRMCLGCD